MIHLTQVRPRSRTLRRKTAEVDIVTPSPRVEFSSIQLLSGANVPIRTTISPTALGQPMSGASVDALVRWGFHGYYEIGGLAKFGRSASICKQE